MKEKVSIFWDNCFFAGTQRSLVTHETQLSLETEILIHTSNPWKILNLYSHVICHILIFQLLAEADVNAKTNNKQTVLHIAATKDHSVIATVLLENAIDYDAVDENLDNGG